MLLWRLEIDMHVYLELHIDNKFNWSPHIINEIDNHIIMSIIRNNFKYKRKYNFLSKLKT